MPGTLFCAYRFQKFLKVSSRNETKDTEDVRVIIDATRKLPSDLNASPQKCNERRPAHFVCIPFLRRSHLKTYGKCQGSDESRS